MPRLLLAVSIAILALVQNASAGPMKKTVLAPIDHVNATLVIVDADGKEVAYSQAELEQFTTYSMTTKTPWREEPATFEGVLLNEVLAASGLGSSVSIVVTAENDYSTVLSDALLREVDILVATRVNGLPHNRRNRGPIQFVIDHEVYEQSALTSESNFVWMAARIEPES